MTVTVVGFGVTGRAVAVDLGRRGEVVAVVEDAPSEDQRQQAAALGLRLVEHPDDAELRALVAASRLVVPSPGVPVSHPVYRLAAEAGVPVRSEIELGWQRLTARDDPPTLVAVTGTNGKTTVTSLAAAMLAASGLTAVAAGNIGLPFIEAANLPADVVVAEVSSFQLQYTDEFRPAVSCWLNLAEDHLDWHPSMAHYGWAKARIWAAQGEGDAVVLNADDAAVMAIAVGVPHGVRQVTFSLQEHGDFRVEHRPGRDDMLIGSGLGLGDVELVGVGELPRALPLDLANALAAAAVALAAGATVEGCRAALRQFLGLPHRIELVADFGDVRWYDDSKATTPASVLAALAGFGSVVLIAGGRNKGLDLGPLGRAVPPVRSVVAIGDAAKEIEAAFAGQVPVVVVDSMAAAVRAAADAAEPGDAVLLSPGCTSFDWYRSYAERGDDFAALVAARMENEGRSA